MKLRQLLFCLVCLLFVPAALRANNLVITNVSFVNVSAGAADIQFELSWDNSWRTSWDENGNTVTVTNWDAVWVFAKFRQSGGLWKHVMLTPTGHSICADLHLDVPADNGTNTGAMIYRNAEGSGPVTCGQVRLHWNYAASGLSGTNEVDIAVMGVEMVYIPEGAYYLGSGGSEGNPFHRYPDLSQPYLVSNADAIAYGPATGNLYATAGTYETIPAAFPNGYPGFYCMKYETTQGQYTDFLNLLDPPVAAASYYPNRYGQGRHTITYTNGAYHADAPDRAMNYVTTQFILGYLDWSGLRPMTELEFEKICRGPRMPVINEYPWGTTTFLALTGFSGVEGSGTETALPTNANCHFNYNPIGGPVRVGIFATGSSSRDQAGAAYFGVMEMGGNLIEFTVQVCRPEGRMFAGGHGDGNEYNALPSDWQPAPGSRAYMMRGYGFWDLYYVGQARTSDRSNADGSNQFSSPDSRLGFRGVRTVP